MNFQQIALESEPNRHYINGCVYRICCNKNHMLYIGATGRDTKRLKEHQRALDGQYHYNSYLQADYDEYGKNAFEYEILQDRLHSDFQLDIAESIHMAKYPREQLYCQQSGGKIGYHLFEKARQKIRDKWQNDEYRQKVREGIKKAWQNPDYRKQQSLNRSKYHNKTGFYRVSKKKLYKGFTWKYQWVEDGRSRTLTSVDLFKLKQKVLANNLEWAITDVDKARKTLMEEMK